MAARVLALLCAAVLVNALLLWNFHDQHWYAVDEGNYAHVAERLVAGEVLHRDVQDVHPGYVNFVNAAAFRVFGTDLVSLRYPLAVVAFAQAILVWFLLARRNVVLATAASIAATAFGVIHFLNPTAHWYCLFFAVCLVCWLVWVPRGHPGRVFGAGVLLGLITMFRHLTGIWAAMAVLVILLRERDDGTESRGPDTLWGRGIVLVMLLALLAYLTLTRGPDATGIVLVASWPVSILCLALATLRTRNHAVLAMVVQLAAGAVVAALPMALYLLAHGAFTAWINDTVFASMELSRLSFYDQTRFALLPVAGMLNVVRPSDPVAVANGLYWILLSLTPAINGYLAFRAMRQYRPDIILPVFASFYSMVTLHLPGPIYLHYAAGLAMAAVLWSAADWRRSARACVVGTVAALVCVAVVYQAAQSPFRRPVEIARGHRTLTNESSVCPPFPRSTLRVESENCSQYHRLSKMIQAETSPGDYIFAVPSDAELYFLAERRNPFRFYNTALGIRSESDVAAVLKALADRPPRIVTYRPDDKYNTDASQEVMRYVRSTYDRFDTVGGIELYRPRVAHAQEDQ